MITVLTKQSTNLSTYQYIQYFQRVTMMEPPAKSFASDFRYPPAELLLHGTH